MCGGPGIAGAAVDVEVGAMQVEIFASMEMPNAGDLRHVDSEYTQYCC